MKKFLIISGLFIATLGQAGNHTIVIQGTSSTNIDKTTVTGQSNDTLTVRPAVDASIIIVALKHPDGTVLDERQCAATWNDQVTIIAPAAMPHGYFLEVRDDKGFLYREFNQ